MYRFKVVAAVAFVALLTASVLQGQDSQTKVKGVLPPNWGKLGLSDEQKQKIYKAQAEYGDKITALEKQVTDLKVQQKTEMSKVLTDAQKTKLKEILLGEDKK